MNENEKHSFPMDEVIEVIFEYYKKALRSPCVRNKIAWALYKTWKLYDEKEI